MKRQLIGLMMVAILMIAVPVSAGPNTVGGAFIGAGSGALLGQAFGRNTEATLAGTFIGGILGAAIGSDMDRDQRRRSGVVYTTHRPRQRVETVVIDRYDRHDHRDGWYDEDTCEEVELMAGVDGYRERIKATACLDEEGRWVIENPKKVVNKTVIVERPVTTTRIIVKNRPSRKRRHKDSRRRHRGRDHHREWRHRSSIQYPVWW